MKPQKAMHFCANYLINPTNPVTVNLIGAGGSGSQMLSELARMNYALIALGHAGLHLHLYDDDIISQANVGRQKFVDCEVGLKKSVALINRTNRAYGFNWKAVTQKYCPEAQPNLPQGGRANIIISCVDTANARFGIAEVLKRFERDDRHERNSPYYWMDLGNATDTGQVILSTAKPIQQPKSEQYAPIAQLPKITDEFRELLEAQNDNNEPSCSLAEALERQDLYVNSTLANLSASLLWKMFRNGSTDKRGYFMNLADGRVSPVMVE